MVNNRIELIYYYGGQWTLLDEFDRDLTSFSFASGHRSLQRWDFKGTSSLNRLISAIFKWVNYDISVPSKKQRIWTSRLWHLFMRKIQRSKMFLETFHQCFKHEHVQTSFFGDLRWPNFGWWWSKIHMISTFCFHIVSWLVVTGACFMTFHILGMSLSQVTSCPSFFRGVGRKTINQIVFLDNLTIPSGNLT